jgi:hypothetical protein
LEAEGLDGQRREPVICAPLQQTSIGHGGICPDIGAIVFTLEYPERTSPNAPLQTGFISFT